MGQNSFNPETPQDVLKLGNGFVWTKTVMALTVTVRCCCCWLSRVNTREATRHPPPASRFPHAPPYSAQQLQLQLQLTANRVTLYAHLLW